MFSRSRKLIGLLILISALILFWFKSQCGPSQVCFQRNCFQVELARSQAEQTRGLSFRQSLAPDRAMLFIFNQPGKYPFWMKNTLIPLDIIWLDKEKRIVFVKENTQPCSETNCPLFYPGGEAQYALEMNAGSVEKLGLIEGEIMSFK